MLDIHSHIIYGLDDGAKTLDDSIELMSQAIENGIDHIIATPHYNDFVKEDFFVNRDKNCKKLNAYAKDKNLDLFVEYGCEISFQIDWDRFSSYEECAIRHKYLLLEFSDIEIPDNYMQTIFEIRKKGYIPIIAHPERCLKIQENHKIATELHRLGCLFQLDAGSLKNHFGKDTAKTAKKFIDLNLYHLIGSDAHSPRGRNYHVFKDIDLSKFQNNRMKSDQPIEEQMLNTKNEQSFFQKLKYRFKGSYE